MRPPTVDSMTNIELITVEASDVPAANRFYRAVGLADRVRVELAAPAGTGFRGFTLSLVVAQPADVEAIMDAAARAGADTVKPAAKSLWGYGGTLRAPDGTIVTIASSSKKDTGPASANIEQVVLQLGVHDVAASRRFYEDHGFVVSKSYGRRYVEFETGRVTLTLNPRRALAKVVGVSLDDPASHGISILTDAAPFSDPDGFVWDAAQSREATEHA